jgi:hypothetical protein
MTLYNLACIYALAGRPDSALDCLETARALGFAHRNWVEHDSNLDSLRSLHRYVALVERWG